MREENERKGEMRMNLNVIHAPEKRTSNIFNNTKDIHFYPRKKHTPLFVFFCLWLNMAQISGCPLSLHSCLPFSRAIQITSLSNHKKQTNTHTNKNGGRGKRQHQHEEELEFTRRARLQEYLESGFSLSVRRFLMPLCLLLLLLLSVR